MSRHIFSLDIETTGLDPEYCQILEVACIAWDLDEPDFPVDDLPRFHCYVDNGITIHGEPFAFSMHPEILRRIANGDKGWDYFKPTDVAQKLRAFASDIKGGDKQAVQMQFAGKNFGTFDFQFLRRLPAWSNWIRAAHRSYDPAILYFDPMNDDRLPDMDTCCKRAGLLESGNSLMTKHDAMGDAAIVVRLLKAKWFGSLLNN